MHRERLAPGVEIGLKLVRMAVNEQCLSVIPTLFLGATEPRPFGTLDAVWLTFQALANNKTPVISGVFFSPLPTSSSGARSSASSGPRPAGNGRDQGRIP